MEYDINEQFQRVFKKQIRTFGRINICPCLTKLTPVNEYTTLHFATPRHVTPRHATPILYYTILRYAMLCYPTPRHATASMQNKQVISV